MLCRTWKKVKKILEDGQEYFGHSFGSKGERLLEIVFNTSMTGYQEILSEPSYAGQAVVMIYPLIGNYGMAEDDYETDIPTGLNLAMQLEKRGILSECGVEILGTGIKSIRQAEDRDLFKKLCEEIGKPISQSENCIVNRKGLGYCKKKSAGSLFCALLSLSETPGLRLC